MANIAGSSPLPPPKALKWLNKNLKLSFQRRRPSNSNSSLTLSPPSPTSPLGTPSSSSKRTVMARTAKREDELRDVFRRFDTDGDGKISASELRAFFGSIGENMSHQEAEGVIRDLDTDGDCLIDFGDFMKLMKMDGDEDLRRAFEMFEHEKGSGCITPKGLQMMLRRLGDTKSVEDCEAMIRFYDIDGNGVLDFHEFNQMMA